MKRRPLRRSSPDRIDEWRRDSARRWRNRRRRNPTDLDAYADARRLRRTQAADRCEADGLHAPDCPGYGTVAHHVQPVSKDGPDTADNLLWVWGGATGSAGCHARIHNNPAEARIRGHLR